MDIEFRKITDFPQGTLCTLKKGASVEKTSALADDLSGNNIIYFDTEAERDKHFRVLEANMEKGLDRYAGFEEIYKGIDTFAPVMYIVK